ncbi:MAG: helix-turn-helix domain-containing protein [Fimbriimonadaceae bacterium]
MSHRFERLEWTEVPLSGDFWQSSGGPAKAHPARTLPKSLTLHIEPRLKISALELEGVFARWANCESPGTVGARLALFDRGHMVFAEDLINGCHYTDAMQTDPREPLDRESVAVETCGRFDDHGDPLRWDRLRFLVGEVEADSFVFQDQGEPSSFIIRSVRLGVAPASGCPFRGGGGRVSLLEVGAAVRVGDAGRVNVALDQLEAALLHPDQSLDDAKGEALTFIAVVSAATLDIGAAKGMHRVQLDAARVILSLESVQEVAMEARRIVSEVTQVAWSRASGAERLVQRAQAIVDRQFARDLTDHDLAEKLGLSTSHFRHLFRQVTGTPFHKYLIAVRLEKARMLLIEQQDLKVADVAAAVGFSGLSHFSRAFSKRFAVSPNQIRRPNAERGESA